VEYSNFVPQGTKHRDLPSTCPPQYRSRIETLRNKPDDGKWREEQLDRCARVAREIALSDAAPSSTQTERPVVRQREPLSVESQPKLLKLAQLRQRVYEAEARYGDPYMPGDPDIDDIQDIDDLEFDSIKHTAWAAAHLAKAAKLEASDQQHDQHKASAHYAAVSAHLQAANVHGSKDASLNSKDAATKAAKKASQLANVS